MFFLLFRSHKQVSRCFIPMIMKWWHDELMKINILKSYSSGNNQYRGGSGWNNLKDRCFWLWQWYFVDFWHAIAHIHLSRSVSPPSPAMLLPMSMLSVFCSQDSRVIGGDLEADGAMTELLCNPGCIFSRNNPFCKTFTLLLSCDQVEQNDHNLRSRLSIWKWLIWFNF